MRFFPLQALVSSGDRTNGGFILASDMNEASWIVGVACSNPSLDAPQRNCTFLLMFPSHCDG